MTREIPHSPVALHEVAHLFGALVAETILASVHVRAHKQAGHMDASDLIKALQNTLQGGGRPHMGNVVKVYFGADSVFANRLILQQMYQNRHPYTLCR
jgi:hypothetical protein